MSNFTFLHYENTLKLALDKGYNFLKCEQYKHIPKIDKLIIMRHDVDFSLKNALKFAQIENNLGIQSTYFIRLHAKQYNPLGYENFQIINQIKELNHEISLHHEPDFAYQFDDPIEYTKNEIHSFNSLFNISISGISTHEPSRRGIMVNETNLTQFPIEYESYSPIFTKQMKYISDSGCRWREGDMREWIEKHHRKLYINTHPFWWFEKTPLENY
jgi:hypothetical protein